MANDSLDEEFRGDDFFFYRSFSYISDKSFDPVI